MDGGLTSELARYLMSDVIDQSIIAMIRKRELEHGISSRHGIESYTVYLADSQKIICPRSQKLALHRQDTNKIGTSYPTYVASNQYLPDS